MELELAHALAERGIADPAVLAAIARVDRSRFVPPGLAEEAHADTALPIGWGQTISQPYVVAAMTSAVGARPGARVLEIGTGSGYQAAVLAELGCEVWSIERLEALAERAAITLATLGLRVHLRVGDGGLGWPSEAPFDGVLVTAAAPRLPPALLDQLGPEGRLVAPIGGDDEQELVVITRSETGFDTRPLFPVRFVPLVTGGTTHH